MTVWHLRDLYRRFDRVAARRIYIADIPLPGNRMPNDEELYAAHHRKVASLCRRMGLKRITCGLDLTLFQPDKPLDPNDFLPFPPLEPPRLEFFSSLRVLPRRPAPSEPDHRLLRLLMGTHLAGVAGVPSVEAVAEILQRGPETPLEKGIIHQLLDPMAMEHVGVMRTSENLSARQLGRSVLAAGVRRYDLSRFLEQYCKPENWARPPSCADGQADR